MKQEQIGSMAGVVRAYLQTQEDLQGASQVRAAEDLGIPARKIRHQLKRLGTSWQQEKTREKTRRLEGILERPGKVSIRKATVICGFTGSDAFLLFFKRVMGMTFTDWRLARQQEGF